MTDLEYTTDKVLKLTQNISDKIDKINAREEAKARKIQDRNEMAGIMLAMVTFSLAIAMLAAIIVKVLNG